MALAELDVAPEAPPPRVYEMLSEGEACLFAILTDHSGLDLAEFTWVDDSRPDGCWRAWPFQWPWWRTIAIKQIDQCVAGGQLVDTGDGPRPIEEVEEGTLVRTHLGRWAPVTHRWEVGARDVVTVRDVGGRTLTVTAEHKVWARAQVGGGLGRPEWRAPEPGLFWATVGDEASWARIVEVAPAGVATVYDLEVEGDHSYVVDGIVVSNCARSIGKSESIMARGCAFPFNHPGGEMVVTAPEGIHVDAITDRLEHKLTSIRLLREMLSGGRNGIKHKPFHCNFGNGSRIMGRIPQRSGIGVKGTHPVSLEMDEGQDYPEKGWVEILETLNRAVEGAEWRVHGVTRGVRDRFYEYTQDSPDNDFVVHRITALHRPTWTDAERESKLKEYGSENDPDFRRNVYGLHGDATNPIFVLARFMHCCDQNEGDAYNSEEYYYRRLTAEMIEDRVGLGQLETSSEEYATAAIELLDLPESHHRYKVSWAGMDVGLTTDPSEILIFGEYALSAEEKRNDSKTGLAVPLDNQTRLKLLTRVHMERIPDPLQADIIMHLIGWYRPRAFSLDKTGLGLPLLQELQKRAGISRLAEIRITDEDAADEDKAKAATSQAAAKQALTVIKGYNFSEKVVVEIDEEKAAELPATATPQEIADKAGIKKHVKDYATDCLRVLVDQQRVLLPWDKELINQWNGQTWSYSQSPIDAYGNRRRSFSEGTFHALDAGRMAAIGMFQEPIEAMLKAPPKRKRPVLAQFGL